MIELYNKFLYEPLFNALFFISNFMPAHDLGLAIIVLTVIIRLIFLPLSIKSQRSHRALSSLNPQIQAIKEKFKNDQAAQGAALMQLYKENKINPLSGCLPILIQLPILIALYQAFMAGLKTENLSMIYSFVQNPGIINASFLGIIDITTRSIALALLAGVLQFLQARQSSKLMTNSGSSSGTGDQLAALNKQILYFFPALIVIIGWNLPAGLILYWITTTLFSIGEQVYIQKTV